MRVAVGIDIGGTNVAVALVTKQGDIVHKEKLAVATMQEGGRFLEQLNASISNMVELHSGAIIDGIGIGTPGANIEEGIIEKASNLPWDKLPIVNFLKGQFALPTYITNDANLFAIGEKVFGVASDCKNFAVLTLGTGVGAGVYINDSLLYGRDGLAGEVGHVVVIPGGRSCHCGRRGCLERYVSASGLVLTARQLLHETSVPSILRDIPETELLSDIIAEAAMLNDHLAQEVFKYTGDTLGQALANMEAYLNPDAIFLAGGLCKAGPLLFDPTISSYKKNRLQIYPRETPILLSSIPDDASGIMGAAALVWDSQQHTYSFKESSVILSRYNGTNNE